MIAHTVDPDQWLDELPLDYSGEVVPPLTYEQHEDEASYARMVIGRDAEGRRCYMRHTHTLTEDRFDIDEFPIEVAVQRERLIAWRLRSGQWLRVVDRMDRLDSCRPRLHRQGPEPVAAAALL